MPENQLSNLRSSVLRRGFLIAESLQGIDGHAAGSVRKNLTGRQLK
jgi:hypothetical protein